MCECSSLTIDIDHACINTMVSRFEIYTSQEKTFFSILMSSLFLLLKFGTGGTCKLLMYSNCLIVGHADILSHRLANGIVTGMCV